MREWLLLSTDHDLNRPRKLCPSKRVARTGATLAVTFETRTLPILSERIRKIGDGRDEPSANWYVRFPRKSLSLIVPVRIRVSTTSAGTLTSAEPLSTTKSSLIASFIVT